MQYRGRFEVYDLSISIVVKQIERYHFEVHVAVNIKLRVDAVIGFVEGE